MFYPWFVKFPQSSIEHDFVYYLERIQEIDRCWGAACLGCRSVAQRKHNQDRLNVLRKIYLQRLQVFLVESERNRFIV